MILQNHVKPERVVDSSELKRRSEECEFDEPPRKRKRSIDMVGDRLLAIKKRIVARVEAGDNMILEIRDAQYLESQAKNPPSYGEAKNLWDELMDWKNLASLGESRVYDRRQMEKKLLEIKIRAEARAKVDSKWTRDC
eukprot:UN25877